MSESPRIVTQLQQEEAMWQATLHDPGFNKLLDEFTAEVEQGTEGIGLWDQLLNCDPRDSVRVAQLQQQIKDYGAVINRVPREIESCRAALYPKKED